MLVSGRTGLKAGSWVLNLTVISLLDILLLKMAVPKD